MKGLEDMYTSTRTQFPEVAFRQVSLIAITLTCFIAIAASAASARPARPYGGFAGPCGDRLRELPKMCVEFKNAANEPVGFFLEWTENGKPMSPNLTGRAECRDGSAQAYYCSALQKWFHGNSRIDGASSNRWIHDSDYPEGFRVTNLAYDSEYCFHFRAVDSSGEPSYSWSGWACGRTPPQLETPPAPARPPQVTAIASTSGKGEIGPGTPFKVLVEWDPSPNEYSVTAWYSIELKKGQEWFRQGQARYQPGVNEGVVEFPNGSQEDESYLFRVCAENIVSKSCSPTARTSGRWWDAARARNPGPVFNNQAPVKADSRRPPSETGGLIDRQDKTSNLEINQAVSDVENQRNAQAEALKKKADDLLHPDGRGRVSENEAVKPSGRISLPEGTVAPARPICDVAREARARNNAAAAGLEGQCLALINSFATRGEAIANQDPAAVTLRNAQPDGSARRGFDIGMAAAEGQTSDGPGKQSILKSLPAAEQAGYTAAVFFSLARNQALVENSNADLAARGEAIANQDPLAVELREQQPEGAVRRGFDIGMATAEGQTGPGPGKDRIRDSLPPNQRQGFITAVAFTLERNKYAQRAIKGAEIAAADPVVAAVRNAETDPFYRLGFDIATAIFGDPALGAQGNTATGPGSLGIRDSLSPAGQRGFNDAVKLHLGRNYKP